MCDASLDNGQQLVVTQQSGAISSEVFSPLTVFILLQFFI